MRWSFQEWNSELIIGNMNPLVAPRIIDLMFTGFETDFLAC